ncbi:MAG: chemotaxis protein CheA [Candidatus Omnitrophica bacterium]|nr:chemotaxis protein CheA [Candidatus Omnitrophota bacterium]
MDVGKFSDVFRDEAFEIIERIEQSLVELEKDPGNTETINTIFRGMHTIKGSGAMFGFDRASKFAHEFETLFDLIRKGSLSATKEIIDLTLAAADHLKAVLVDEGSVSSGETATLIHMMRTTTGIAPDAPVVKNEKVETSVRIERNTYRILFAPNEDIFMHGAKLEPLFNELRRTGDCVIVAAPSAISLDTMDAEKCYTAWTIILSTDKDSNAVRDIFIFVEDVSKISIEVIDTGSTMSATEEYKRIGDILVERGDINEEDLSDILSSRKMVGEIAVEKGYVTEAQVTAALAEQNVVRGERMKRRDDAAKSSIRVKSEKLDRLVNLVGELVTLTARFNLLAGGKRLGEGHMLSEMLARLTDELRDTSMALRMIPVDEMFKGFSRLVRDLSKDLGKDIDLVIAGAETELDKNIIEALKDPLMHIIRNAADHGIESPETRQANGKESKGTITLSASHAGAHVLITVSDDGGGLNRSRILKKAIERGLVKENVELSAHDIEQMIFLPGFSTVEKATSVSGRGVGMDVVKRNVEKLRGIVEIKSTAGHGTTFILKIPLTLAIVDGLLARIGGDYFVLNLSNVDECVDLTEDIVSTGHGSNVVNIRGEIIPYVRLRKYFNINGTEPAIERMVVTKLGDLRVGLVVDDVLGQHQTVIKSLGNTFRGVEEIAGATILGDGTVALILDANAIVAREIAARKENTNERLHRMYDDNYPADAGINIKME